MADPWLIIDVSYLAHRNYYAMGGLSYDGEMTGVSYGVLKDIITLKEFHQTERFAFCFDRGLSKRALYYQDYKAKRKETPPEDRIKKNDLQRQIRDLYNVHLRTIGFRNIFSQKNYEADDLIASLVLYSLGRSCNREAIIVSSDHDLYQLLSQDVSIWDPGKKILITEEKFREEWGICPTQWVDVKAMAGCSSDNIKGIQGIGEKTAVKHLCGTLNPQSKAFERIIKGTPIWESNLKLVQLPFEGTKKMVLKEDRVTAKGWHKVTKSLGISSLRW